MRLRSKRLLSIGSFAALLGFVSLGRVQADQADEAYVQIVGVIQKADELSSEHTGEALSKYREAQIALQAFKAKHPGWNTKAVEFRIDYLAGKILTAPTNAPTAGPRTVTVSAPPKPVSGLGGMFPKMSSAAKAFVVDGENDTKQARMTAWSLQGMINQTSAEIYILNNPWHLNQLEFSGKPFEVLDRLDGENAGLRTLFKRYQDRVEKMFVYNPEKDWTWYLSLMSAAQQHGIAVTESVGADLTSEFGWKGQVIDFRSRWTNRFEAYDWALSNLMPHCNRQTVFALGPAEPLNDYAAASRGFVFSLNFKSERSEVRKIFQTPGYGVGTSLMGYANTGDEANEVANPYGIGYVVSDFYANGSFWSSFPNKTYTQTAGRVVNVQPGKIYASIMWSDGDNISFDQNPLYLFWHDPARGSIPVATELSPTLQELNPPLLDWYYAKMTDLDELVAGPTGVQFIFIRDFRDDHFWAWCKLTRIWCAGAGFHAARIWIAPNPSAKFTTYMKTCGFDGVFGEGWFIKGGFPPKVEAYGAADEEDLFKQFTAISPEEKRPVFVNFTAIVAGFNKHDGGYSAIKRQVERIEKEYPGRYFFLLPKDQFATIRSYYSY